MKSLAIRLYLSTLKVRWRLMCTTSVRGLYDHARFTWKVSKVAGQYSPPELMTWPADTSLYFSTQLVNVVVAVPYHLLTYIISRAMCEEVNGISGQLIGRISNDRVSPKSNMLLVFVLKMSHVLLCLISLICPR